MLTVLNLHSNSLSGEIPDLSGASMLEDLYLAGNADYVTNDDGKKKVKVDGTGLTGEIPMWLNGIDEPDEPLAVGQPAYRRHTRPERR